MATSPSAPSALTALSPLDGRYHAKVAALRGHFSELALIRHRVLVEVVRGAGGGAGTSRRVRGRGRHFRRSQKLGPTGTVKSLCAIR